MEEKFQHLHSSENVSSVTNTDNHPISGRISYTVMHLMDFLTSTALNKDNTVKGGGMSGIGQLPNNIQASERRVIRERSYGVGLRSLSGIRPPELTLGETSLCLNEGTQIIHSSQGHTWANIAAVLTHEEPQYLYHRQIPHLWLAMVFNDVEHQRIIDDKTIRHTLRARSIVITPPNKKTEDAVLGTASVLHMFLRHEMLSEVAEELFERFLQDIEIRPDCGVTEPGLQHLMQSVEYMLRQPVNTRLQSDYIACSIASQILRHHSVLPHRTFSVPSGAGLSTSQIKRVNDFIRNNLGDNFLLADLASVVGLSRTAFFDRFKRTLKQTPHQYLQTMRVQRAQELLRFNTLPLAEIAVICGFADQAHLTRVFRQYAGITPGQYRKSMQ